MWAKSSTRYGRARAHAAEEGGAAAQTLTGARCGLRGGAAADRAPLPPWVVLPDRGAAPPWPLVLPRRFAGPGRCGPPRGPRRGRGPQCCRLWLLPRRRLAPLCWRRPAGASRRARPGQGPRVCGEENGPPPRPLPCRGSRGKPGEARAVRRLFPPPSRSGSDFSLRSILSPCRRTVASWKAAFTALCIPRAGFPGLSPRLLQVSAWRFPPPLLTLPDRGLGVGAFATSPLTFGPIDRVKSRRAGRASVVEGLRCLGGPSVLGLFDENSW